MTAVDPILVEVTEAPISVTVASTGLVLSVASGTVGPAGAQGPAGTNGSNGTNGQGVPAGGTTGQVLAKKTGTNYDTEWVDQSGGGGGGSGTVTSVTGTAPISVATGTTTPVVSISAATTSAAGSMSSADKAKLDGVEAGATANSIDAQLRARSTHTGTQTLSTISDAGTAAAKNVPATGDAAAGEVVLGADTRLTNARTPTAHKASHATGGTDALEPSDIGAVPTTRTVNGSALSADITISAAPSGSAGGDLTGTYPNPTIGAGKVTVAKLSATGTASSSTFLRGDGSWATATDSGALQKTSNLSDLGTLSTARSNLGVPPVGSGYVSSVNVSGLIAETFCPSFVGVGNTSLLVSGRLQMVGIYIPAGTTVTSISFCSRTTALATATNQWFVLCDSSRTALRYTVDDTSTAWAANTVKTLALTSTYTVSTSGLYYLGIMVAATTVPTVATSTASNLALFAESFRSTTGYTTAPATGTTFTLGTREGTTPWAAIS